LGENREHHTIFQAIQDNDACPSRPPHPGAGGVWFACSKIYHSNILENVGMFVSAIIYCNCGEHPVRSAAGMNPQV